ncbi:MAG: hypothetical protein MJZ12_06175, partial [Prevotella sp.]|nr:hypothetical protein [Prevotella sp.]
YLLHYLLTTTMEEDETRRLLNETIELLKEEKKAHARDMAAFMDFAKMLNENHEERVKRNSTLLQQSEERIASTNEMVQKLSQNCYQLVEVNRTLEKSYVQQFERVTNENRLLLEEVAQLRKEKEAYYESVKIAREHIASANEKLDREREQHRADVEHERKRYDEVMAQLMNYMCQNHGNVPMVNIDQKPNNR